MENMNVFGNSIVDTIKCDLKKEFEAQYRGGIYAITQKMLTFNSNHMEGSTLTEEQTSLLFDTGTVYGNDVYRAKDIEEAQGHFWMFNEMIKSLNEPLSEQLIKHFHYCLKTGVFIYRANGYLVGEYKNRANVAGIETTTPPEKVAEEMATLMKQYHAITKKNLQDIVWFHSVFEHIHPFQDGNGRVGRLILFREALVNDLVPPVILSHNHTQYVIAMRESHNGDYSNLLRIAEEAQDSYLERIRKFIGD